MSHGLAGSIGELHEALEIVRKDSHLPHEYRYHASVLSEHLCEIVRSEVFNDIDNLFRMLAAFKRNRRLR